jgi:hypothetical protein
VPVLTLLTASAVQVMTGASFLVVGERVRGRPSSAAGRQAALAFVAWWWSMGSYMLVEGTAGALASFGHAPLALHIGVRIAAAPLIAAAAAGLAYYVLFLFLGRAWLLAPILVYYGFAGAAYAYAVGAGSPDGVAVGAWHAGLTYRDDLAGSPLWTGILASFGLPLVAGSVGYLALLPRVHDRAQRYRILLVGCSLLTWVLAGFVGQVAAGAFWQFVTLVVVGLFTGATVLAAYFPPHRVQAWLERPAHH